MHLNLSYFVVCFLFFFFFNDTATTEIYTLSLHDALPISRSGATGRPPWWQHGSDMTEDLKIVPSGANGAGARDPEALVEEFARSYPFELDEFQRRGCLALAAGRGALVAAPTGAGKTVVGEFAVWLALREG